MVRVLVNTFATRRLFSSHCSEQWTWIWQVIMYKVAQLCVISIVEDKTRQTCRLVWLTKESVKLLIFCHFCKSHKAIGFFWFTLYVSLLYRCRVGGPMYNISYNTPSYAEKTTPVHGTRVYVICQYCFIRVSFYLWLIEKEEEWDNCHPSKIHTRSKGRIDGSSLATPWTSSMPNSARFATEAVYVLLDVRLSRKTELSFNVIVSYLFTW